MEANKNNYETHLTCEPTNTTYFANKMFVSTLQSHIPSLGSSNSNVTATISCSSNNIEMIFQK
jgi:hypothetical protein